MAPGWHAACFRGPAALGWRRQRPPARLPGAGPRRFPADAALRAGGGAPLHLGIDSAANVAPRPSYLRADARQVDAFRQRLARQPGRKLGLVWRGAAGNAVNRRRALDEAALAPLLALAGWTPVSLQFGVRDPALAGQPLLDLSEHIADFEDLAAAMQAVDAVVALDTGPAHLAGALGLRCYTLLPALHDWRWGEGGTRCDWYPSMTLVRQDGEGSWQEAVRQLGAALAGGDYRAPPLQPRAPGAVLRNHFPAIELAGGSGAAAVPLLDPGVTRARLLEAAARLTSPAAASPLPAP